MSLSHCSVPQLEGILSAPNSVEERMDVLLELSKRYRQNEVAKSLEYDLQAKELAEENNDTYRWALALRYLSDDYMLLGDNIHALHCLQECLVLVEPMHDPDKMAGIYINIGAIHNRMENPEKAELYYNKALEYYQAANDELGVAKCLANVGLLRMEAGAFELAEDNFNRSIAISRRLGARIGEAINYSNLGNLYGIMRAWPKALELYQKSYSVYQELGNQGGIAAALVNLGHVSASLGDFDKAIGLLTEAVNITQTLGLKYYGLSAHKNLFEIYENKSQWELAFKHLLAYQKLKEEVLSNEAKQKAAEIEVLGMVAIKEKELEISKLRNVELRQAYEDLHTTQQALIDKERMAVHGKLASEIAHEVQNPLQFVNNFAALNIELVDELREAMENGDEKEVEDVLTDLTRNCQSIEEHGKRAANIIMQLQLKR